MTSFLILKTKSRDTIPLIKHVRQKRTIQTSKHQQQKAATPKQSNQQTKKKTGTILKNNQNYFYDNSNKTFIIHFLNWSWLHILKKIKENHEVVKL